jgi:hypothetical protein
VIRNAFRTIQPSGAVSYLTWKSQARLTVRRSNPKRLRRTRHDQDGPTIRAAFALRRPWHPRFHNDSAAAWLRQPVSQTRDPYSNIDEDVFRYARE